MNGYYLYFTLIILSKIKIIISLNDEFLQLNINSDFDEDNKNDYTLKSNMKNLFLYGTHLSEFLISQNKREEEYINETIKLYNVFRNELGYILNNVSMSLECRKYLEKYLIGKDEPYPLKYSNYHIKKLIDDSSKHRNDLSTYEQCMNKNYRLENIGDSTSKGNMTSTYIVYTLDKKLEKTGDNISFPKASTDFEQIYYIRGFCLPQSESEICETQEYQNFLKGINDDLDDLLGINITNIYTFSIREKKLIIDYKFILRLIPLIIFLIQVSLVTCRELIIFSLNKCCGYNIKIENNDLLEEYNQTNNNEENDEDDDDNDNDNEKKKILNHKNVPKWINIYNKCFNFGDNFKELFNFKLNSTSINNDSGLAYIRGFKATSLFMLVAGLTFLTLMNSLSIIFSKTLFLEFLDDKIFYSLFFVGLRYAPRFIFSCSGYTLAYKFLSYIDKNFSFLSIIKFIFYQSHKYLILIGYSLFQRYSLYPLFSSYKDTPMLKFLSISILERPQEILYYILSFFSLSSFFMGNQTERYDQTLIDYFWLPYNEIAFFISGIFIISIGYKFKLRIDNFILILIFIIYIFKILFTYLYIPGKEGYKEPFYPTLYYYLFDYGKFMTNPLFNYPSYFIGMYFGFINYCVQKGIISIKVTDLLQNKANTTTKKTSEKEMNLSINANKSVDEEEEDDDDDEDNNQDNNENIRQNFDENDSNNYRTEIIDMPFLIAGVKISNWLRNHRVRLITALMIVLFIFFIAIHFIALYCIVIKDYTQKINDLKNQDISEEKKGDIRNQINHLLLLKEYLTNNLINFIYRIDIEIVVFLFQCVLFIFYFKGKNFVNNFYCHIFWAMFNKSYFSYILVANPIILFIFYQSETKILLNLYNLILYSLISGTVIFLSASFMYIFFELPYKKLIRIICSNDSNNNDLEGNENEKEEETKSEDEDD